MKAQLRQIIETEIELGIMIHDFQGTPESKEGLLSRVRTLVEEMEALNVSTSELPHQVPLDVVEYIENGRNPDVYTREFVELLAKQNQYVKGKQDAMKEYRNAVANEIKTAYPDLETVVNQVVERTN
ncbi:mediator of RNA polymerase II transcription subunit 10 [Trichomonascus vanleenenianus]|uniref:mediator complex subunit NUT2 n=1 Tax=Trichomonascus vanleenenianus TaxID=2268995 RepID=UPI003EC99FBB